MSRGVSFVKPPEPTFLRRIKEKIGYKDGPDVDTKRQELEAAQESDFRDRDEELPTVVQLKDGDLCQEEAHELLKSQEEDAPPEDGRILFKKPVKRTSEESEKESVKKKKRKSTQPIKNKKLLSFGDDEEEEEDDEDEGKPKR